MSAQVEQYDYEAISTRSTGHGFQGFSTWYQVLECDNKPIGGSVASWEHLVHKKFLKPHDEETATGKDAVFPEWQTATHYRSVGTKRLQGS